MATLKVMSKKEVEAILNRKFEDEGSCIKAKVVSFTKNQIELHENYLDSTITIKLVEEDDITVLYWEEQYDWEENHHRGIMLIGTGRYEDGTVEKCLPRLLVNMGYSISQRY